MRLIATSSARITSLSYTGAAGRSCAPGTAARPARGSSLFAVIFYGPGERDRELLPHDPFKSLVAPRPIGWVSTMAADGSVNLAPYSFFNAIGEGPPMLAFSSNGAKDSSTFAGELREFVWNLVTFELARAMNETSAPCRGGPASSNTRAWRWPPRPGRASAGGGRPVRDGVPGGPPPPAAGHRRASDRPASGRRPGGRRAPRRVGDRRRLVDTAPLRPMARLGGPADYTVVDGVFRMTRPTD